MASLRRVEFSLGLCSLGDKQRSTHPFFSTSCSNIEKKIHPIAYIWEYHRLHSGRTCSQLFQSESLIRLCWDVRWSLGRPRMRDWTEHKEASSTRRFYFVYRILGHLRRLWILSRHEYAEQFSPCSRTYFWFSFRHVPHLAQEKRKQKKIKRSVQKRGQGRFRDRRPVCRSSILGYFYVAIFGQSDGRAFAL